MTRIRFIFIAIAFALLMLCGCFQTQHIENNDNVKEQVSFYDEIHSAVIVHIDSTINLHQYLYPDSIIVGGVVFERTLEGDMAMVIENSFYCDEKDFLGFSHEKNELIGYAWHNKPDSEQLDSLFQGHINKDWALYNNLVQSPPYYLNVNVDGVHVSVYQIDSLMGLHFVGRMVTKSTISINKLHDDEFSPLHKLEKQ